MYTIPYFRFLQHILWVWVNCRRNASAMHRWPLIKMLMAQHRWPSKCDRFSCRASGAKHGRFWSWCAKSWNIWETERLIRSEAEAGSVTVEDTGIGMTREDSKSSHSTWTKVSRFAFADVDTLWQEMINHLGTIAKSGTKAFMEVWAVWAVWDP